jgi:hypothetical protein
MLHFDLGQVFAGKLTQLLRKTQKGQARGLPFGAALGDYFRLAR